MTNAYLYIVPLTFRARQESVYAGRLNHGNSFREQIFLLSFMEELVHD